LVTAQGRSKIARASYRSARALGRAQADRMTL